MKMRKFMWKAFDTAMNFVLVFAGVSFVLASGDWLFEGTIRSAYQSMLFGSGWLYVALMMIRHKVWICLTDPEYHGKREEA